MTEPDTTGWDVPTRAERPAKSRASLRGMCAGVLLPEAIVLGLSAPVLMANGDVSKPIALSVGLGLAVVCVLVCGLLRRPWAMWLGHAVQVVAVGLGFVVPMMFFVGGLFALLWIMAYVLGLRIAEEKLAAWNHWDAQQSA